MFIADEVPGRYPDTKKDVTTPEVIMYIPGIQSHTV